MYDTIKKDVKSKVIHFINWCITIKLLNIEACSFEQTVQTKIRVFPKFERILIKVYSVCFHVHLFDTLMQGETKVYHFSDSYGNY